MRGWDSPVILGSMAGAAVMFAVFLVSQQRSNCPNVDLSVFKIRSFRLSWSDLPENIATGNKGSPVYKALPSR